MGWVLEEKSFLTLDVIISLTSRFSEKGNQ
jgi:hypothetical protein